MNRIWAPWRKVYLLGHRQKKGCLFCRSCRSAPRKDRKNLLLERSRHSFLLLNRYPYTNGHLMVVPNRHVPSLENLKEEERLDFLKLLDRALRVLRKAFHPQGFNVGLNLGQAGGAGIPAHVHLHVVPRWAGDTNFMPILTGTKVISHSLEAAYQELFGLMKLMKK